jgi:hypothetical protein
MSRMTWEAFNRHYKNQQKNRTWAEDIESFARMCRLHSISTSEFAKAYADRRKNELKAEWPSQAAVFDQLEVEFKLSRELACKEQPST